MRDIEIHYGAVSKETALLLELSDELTSTTRLLDSTGLGDGHFATSTVLAECKARWATALLGYASSMKEMGHQLEQSARATKKTDERNADRAQDLSTALSEL